MSRREFVIIVGTVAGAAVGACERVDSPISPTTPEPTKPPVTLLTKLQEMGRNATTEANRTGGVVILIDGSRNWNFKINDVYVSIGPANTPTLHMNEILIPNDAILTVVQA